MDQEKIGKFILKLRKDNNLTQKQLADKLGVTYQAVSKWETGKNIPDISIMKQISKEFNIDINEILDGEKVIKTQKINWTIIIAILLMLIGLVVFIFIRFNKKADFEFKTLSSTCSSFNISGSIAYNNSKSSIYISNVEYCGGDDNETYKKIECALYDTKNNKEVKISDCNNTNNKDIKLEDYLKDVAFNVDNYSAICKSYSENKLQMKIVVTDYENRNKTYVIPLMLKNNCSK